MDSSCLAVLPVALRREGDRLFNLSMWCLGRDVLHPDNLLLRRGLSRERIPSGRVGTSAYSAVLPGGGVLTLWGFGARCAVDGASLYVPRDGFAPVLLVPGRPGDGVFQASELGASRPVSTLGERSRARAVVAALARWLAGHEDWVEALLGGDWRRECVSALRKAPAVPVEGLAAAWRRWAADVESLAPLAGE